MPQRRVRRQRYALGALIMVIMDRSDMLFLQQLRETAVGHPHRTLANLLVHVAFNSGLVESLHAGGEGPYSLQHRRCNKRQATALLRFASAQLSGVLGTYPVLDANFRNLAPWPEAIGRIVAFREYPRSWSFTATSAAVRLLVE